MGSRRGGGGLACDVSSIQAAQDFGTSAPCDGEDLVSIAAMVWFHTTPPPPFFFFSSPGLVFHHCTGVIFHPKAFHFPAAALRVLWQVCLLPNASLGSEAEQGGPCEHRSRLPLPSSRRSTKDAVFPVPNWLIFAEVPPFSSLVSSDQLTHAWLSITERSCVRVPGARTKPESCPRRKCQYRNARLFTKTPLYPATEMRIAVKTVVPAHTPLLILPTWNVGSFLFLLLQRKAFFFFFAQKRGKHAQKQGDVTAKHTNYSGDS